MKLIIHGGFFSESSTNQETKKAKQDALAEIATLSYKYLKTHTALETVTYTVGLLEDNVLFNAGLGSQIQSDGKVRLSASIMDGKTQKFGGVINAEDIKNPIQLASVLLEYEDSVLSGDGAVAFGRKNGFEYYSPITAQRQEEYELKLNQLNNKGTVGCVALDAFGNLAAGTSTGGKGFEIPSRVSDSATVAGNYANAVAGISCTGVGENIVSVALAARIVTRVTDGFTLKDACDKSFTELQEINGFAGVIGITADGQIYHTDSHPYMVWASFDVSLQVFD
ncbi:isoaspartyl peptidase/L-asparaginase [Pedobacter sp. MR2016-24]|uniref:isoaspartyl peptidase/L-asparaginase n=1 Tax=Pedobacter sp. MR2016-24 TaxID=2994466 RepID=UPI0022478E18|nr:isoaspartyl peptidase/L-asparaginase [Pedobacter sp. MR2016-24]MCX2482141.1 isoaspartyl peptidase/L-asparaginase [Pedobacter sp. MR2016-24]